MFESSKFLKSKAKQQIITPFCAYPIPGFTRCTCLRKIDLQKNQAQMLKDKSLRISAGDQYVLTSSDSEAEKKAWHPNELTCLLFS
ncbi:MAG TPA: hypothetical protein DCM07_08390 [Planctomycetaceae bacterium]|nr:hypothetical protein [Gimesia sp.]HAH44864.1 hypothetical protein [Planctomycetaceae bacterium]HBL48562.1 hypothetical protein [Planctomycetaceae bacterium]|tara:strand:+ start:297 stop:554 length:258 start_codon:yes stop_codon:yes gene_type:complete